ncbi:MAG: hypothetical protein Q4P15_05690 [Propionibacteriaceae bacterium]|nr:hypothetical protein [Propionibacteriaceae bacterium]
MRKKAVAAIAAQGIQAGISFILQIVVLRVLGIDDYGRFAVLYGIVVLVMAVMSGLVGDSLVVLQREEPRIRAALEGFALIMSLSAGCIAAGLAVLTGFADPRESLVFGVGLVSYTIMEIVRRMLIAHMLFTRAAIADATGFGCAVAVLLTGHWTSGLSLWIVLGATAVGQVVGCLVGWRMLPSTERLLVPIRDPDFAAVWRYGSWRGLQQTLRPALFTIVRVLVIGSVGLAAVGILEAARTFVSPLMLVVGSLSSLLFVRFANLAKAGRAGSLREADRVVVALLLLSVALGGIALLLAPWAGPLIFNIELDRLAIIGWITYGISVAMVTPYGALSAVTGRQTTVFFVRLADTALAAGIAAAVLSGGGSFRTVPFVLAATSLLGGVALRWVAARGEPSVDVN